MERKGYQVLNVAKRPYFKLRNAQYMRDHHKAVIAKIKAAGGCKKVSYDTTTGCYVLKGEQMCDYQLEEMHKEKSCDTAYHNIAKKNWQLECCGPTGGGFLSAKIRNLIKRIMKKIMKIILKILFTIAEILFWIVITIAKVILKILEIALLVVEVGFTPSCPLSCIIMYYPVRVVI